MNKSKSRALAFTEASEGLKGPSVAGGTGDAIDATLCTARQTSFGYSSSRGAHNRA